VKKLGRVLLTLHLSMQEELYPEHGCSLRLRRFPVMLSSHVFFLPFSGRTHGSRRIDRIHNVGNGTVCFSPSSGLTTLPFLEPSCACRREARVLSTEEKHRYPQYLPCSRKVPQANANSSSERVPVCLLPSLWHTRDGGHLRMRCRPSV
jgi:hypothetical protein